MRIIFVNRFFHPDHSATSQMLSDLAFSLSESGNRVAVVTSRQLYDTPDARLPCREAVAGIETRRVWTSRFGRHKLAWRAIDYLTFYVTAAWELWRLARPGDIIVAKTDPPMFSVVCSAIAKMRRAQLVNWLQDLFPEVAEALDVSRRSSRRVAYGVLRALRNHSLRRAQMNVAIGKRMAERLASLDVSQNNIRVIPNWADGRLITPRSASANHLREAWGLAGKFVVGYSGNLGRAHEFETLIESIARLERYDSGASMAKRQAGEVAGPGRHMLATAELPALGHEIVWLFIGGGALYGRFQAAVTERGLTSVHFHPYQPRTCLAESLSVPDVHLISLRPEMEGLIVPSKYYGIAASGRPAIFVGDADGEIARLLAAEDAGHTVAPGDSARLAALIQSLAANPALAQAMGRRARRAFERDFDLPVAVAAWKAVFARLNSCE